MNGFRILPELPENAGEYITGKDRFDGMRLCSIASGSSGNCIYVGSEAAHLLVDAGISGKRTEAGLNGLGITGRDLDGILITHEHSDHISGLGLLAKKYSLPIYATLGTLQALRSMSSMSGIDESQYHEVSADKKFTVKDLTINPMRISHDAAEPVGYRISYGSKKIAVCTDLGNFNDYTVECLKGLTAVLLEANHDVHMLEAGPYPYYLKRRILGERGHLSNENSGRLLSRIVHDKMQTIILGHLSKENNLPELAYESVRMEITMGDNPYNADDFRLLVAKRDIPTQPVEIL